MPTSIENMFSCLSLQHKGRVKWGEKILDDKPGVYIVSVSSNPNEMINKHENNPPIDLNIVRGWFQRVPTLTLNGKRPTPEELKSRLSGFWLPDEPILYIGKTGTSLKDRVRQFCNTPLGDKRPHAGGHWLKTLSILKDLYVHWTITSRAEEFENNLIRLFVEGVSTSSRKILADPQKPFPFANIEYPKGNKKKHDINKSVNR